jgi:hypothetical protein
MNEIFKQVTERLSQPTGRVVIAAPGARRQIILSPEHLSQLKAEGSGIRHGKVFYFASQIHFARVVAA